MSAPTQSRSDQGPVAASAPSLPPLQQGDRLSRGEFERRYAAMPELKKAELIEGVVYIMPSPVSVRRHGNPRARLMTWLGAFWAATPGIEAADNTTVRLDQDNEPQPDALLRVLPSHGGQTANADEYVGGAPELVAEVAASSASYDLHDKLNAYRRNGVREYIVWRVDDAAIDWFVLNEGRYEPLPPTAEGILQSRAFPGLWLAPQALLDGDLNAALKVLRLGLATKQHEAFVKQLAAAGTGKVAE